MKRIKQFMMVGIIAVAGILFTSSFVNTEKKQILTLEIKESGTNDVVGIFVYQNGKNVDFIQLEYYKAKRETIVRNGETINSLLNKYYSENWRLISTTSPGGTVGFTRFVFEK